MYIIHVLWFLTLKIKTWDDFPQRKEQHRHERWTYHVFILCQMDHTTWILCAVYTDAIIALLGSRSEKCGVWYLAASVKKNGVKGHVTKWWRQDMTSVHDIMVVRQHVNAWRCHDDIVHHINRADIRFLKIHLFQYEVSRYEWECNLGPQGAMRAWYHSSTVALRCSWLNECHMHVRLHVTCRHVAGYRHFCVLTCKQSYVLVATFLYTLVINLWLWVRAGVILLFLCPY